MSIYLNYDIGHCETTATTLTVKDGKNIVERLRLSGNHEDVIPSALSLTYDQIQKLSAEQIDVKVLESLGEIRIGNDAFTQPKNGEYFVYFKTSPENFNKPCGKSSESKSAKMTYGKLMAVFIYQVIQNTLQYNPDNKALSQAGPDDISLLIGCPATKKWTDGKYVEAYAQMISIATGIKKVAIVPESRAAIFSAIGAENQAISASNGVMVFDFGSSTADCTFMLLGRQIKEYSWDLGASLIEQQLLMSALAHAKKKDPTASIAETRDAMLRALRQAKEYYYRNEQETDITCRFTSTSGEAVKETITVDTNTMEQVTNKDQISIRADTTSFKTGTWQGLCKEFIQKGKDYLTANNLSCQTIILTGGASHMNFIATLCRAVFGPKVKIMRDRNPSYCVATGLSWVAVADERRDECVEDAMKLLKGNDSCSYEKLKRTITDGVYAYACELIDQETNAWANAFGDTLTVRDLENRITARFAKPEEKAAIKRIIEREISDWLVKYKSGASDAINNQSKKIFSENIAAELLLSDDIWNRLDANSVEIELNPSEIVEKLDISSLTNKIIQELAFIVVATAVALVLSEIPVVNYIVGYIAGLIAQKLVSDDDKDKQRKQKARKKIAKKMPKVLKNDEIVASFRTSVADSMATVKTQYDSMLCDTTTIAIDMVMLRRFGDSE